MHYHDSQWNGARARAARIRYEHENEATELDALRRQAERLSRRSLRASRWALLRRAARHTANVPRPVAEPEHRPAPLSSE
jgi:hypothetical protein